MRRYGSLIININPSDWHEYGTRKESISKLQVPLILQLTVYLSRMLSLNYADVSNGDNFDEQIC